MNPDRLTKRLKAVEQIWKAIFWNRWHNKFLIRNPFQTKKNNFQPIIFPFQPCTWTANWYWVKHVDYCINFDNWQKFLAHCRVYVDDVVRVCGILAIIQLLNASGTPTTTIAFWLMIKLRCCLSFIGESCSLSCNFSLSTNKARAGLARTHASVLLRAPLLLVLLAEIVETFVEEIEHLGVGRK